MNFKQKLKLGLVASTAVVLLAACGGGDKKKEADGGKGKGGDTEQVFKLVIPQEMPSLDQSTATDTISFTALNQVMEGLYRLDDEHKPVPAVAKDLAEVSEDGLTYTFELRDDSVWSNGDPVTAHDFVYGWQRTIDPATTAQYASLFEGIENGEDIISGKKEAKELGVKAVEDYKLEVKLARPIPYFDLLMAFPTFFPQNEKYVTEKGKDFATNSDNSIYNGAFTLEDWDGTGNTWKYVKNKDYWDKDAVKLSRIDVQVSKEDATNLNLFEGGQADDVIITGEIAQQKAKDPAFESVMEASSQYLELNQRDDAKTKLFKNTKARQAISLVLDRKHLTDSILGDGSVATGDLVPHDFSFGPDGKDFIKEETSVEADVEKGKKLWAEAMKETGIDKIDIELLTSDTDSSKKTSEYIQGAIEENLEGAKVTLANVPFKTRLDRSEKGEFDIVMGGWGADYTDASSFVDLFATGNPYNRGHWSNAEYDKLIKDAASTLANDPAKRFEALQKAHDIIVKEDGVISIYNKAEAHLVNPKVKGIINHPAGAKHDYKYVTIEK